MNALAHPQTAIVPVGAGFEGDSPELATFDHVPRGCDVVPLGGMVAIFDRRWQDIGEGRFSWSKARARLAA